MVNKKNKTAKKKGQQTAGKPSNADSPIDLFVSFIKAEKMEQSLTELWAGHTTVRVHRNLPQMMCRFTRTPQVR